MTFVRLDSIEPWLRCKDAALRLADIVHDRALFDVWTSATQLMVGDPKLTAVPRQFSIIIPVHDDWEPLEECLGSFAKQENCPAFEVIIVDDGSREAAPECVRRWSKSYPLSIVRQPNAGIASARNRGVQESTGDVLVFTDADCRFRANCLSALAATIAVSPLHNCFQLRLTGNCSNLVGRAEELRLIAIQDHLLEVDGRIRYLNTSGFAIRRSHPSIAGEGPFYPAALRGEDTLLLATLIQRGEIPLFVSSATVQHSISLSFGECLRKDIESAWLEGRTFEVIKKTGIRVRMKNNERLRMLFFTWKLSRQPSIGRSAWAVLIVRQLTERAVSLIYRAVGVQFGVHAEASKS